MSEKLKSSDLAAHRTRTLEAQGGMDPITGLAILDPVLDHSHVSGHCRAVLDRRTNAWEGSVVNGFRRRGMQKMGADLPACLRALADYLEAEWSANPMHPTHKSEDERRESRNRKARLKRRKAKKAPRKS